VNKEYGFKQAAEPRSIYSAEDLRDLAIIGGYKLETTSGDVARWSQEMVEEYPELEGQLDEVLSESQEYLKRFGPKSAARMESEARAVAPQPAKGGPAASRDLTEPKPEDLRRILDKLELLDAEMDRLKAENNEAFKGSQEYLSRLAARVQKLADSRDPNDPKPEDFGLSGNLDELVEQLNAEKLRLEAERVRRQKRNFRIGLLVIAISFATSALVPNRALAFFAFMLGLLLIYIVPNLRRLRGLPPSERFKALDQYFDALKAHRDQVLRLKREFWLALPGVRFEKELALLFEKSGYDVQLTPWSGDGGIDIQLRKEGRTTIVQCKATNKPCGPGVMRELYGALQASGAHAAILASVAGVTEGAREFAEGKPLAVLELADVIRMQDETCRSPHRGRK
jgi:hypothetical protein